MSEEGDQIQRHYDVSFSIFIEGLFYQHERRIKAWAPFTLLFYRKKVAKSSVQGLWNGAPLLKTDRFGDP